MDINNIESVKKMKGLAESEEPNTLLMKANGSTIDHFVPIDEQSTAYQAILAWVAEGNTIEEADE